MQGWPPFPFALTPKARLRGTVTLKVDTVHSTSTEMNQMLLERIYEGQTQDDLIRLASVGATHSTQRVAIWDQLKHMGSFGLGPS
jgi:hypothetical protein